MGYSSHINSYMLNCIFYSKVSFLSYLNNFPISFYCGLCRLDLKGMTSVSPELQILPGLCVWVPGTERRCPLRFISWWGPSPSPSSPAPGGHWNNTCQPALPALTFPFLFSFYSRDLTEQTAPRHPWDRDTGKCISGNSNWQKLLPSAIAKAPWCSKTPAQSPGLQLRFLTLPAEMGAPGGLKALAGLR